MRVSSRIGWMTSVIMALAAAALVVGCGSSGTKSPTASQSSAAGGSSTQGTAAQGGGAQRAVAVAMPGSKNDHSFTQASYDGLLAAASKYHVKPTFIDGITSPQNMLTTLTALAQKNQLVIGAPTEMSPELVAAAKQFPKVHFVLTDGRLQKLPNTSYAVPEWYGPGYVAGAVAAKLSKTGTIAFLGGSLITDIIDGRQGFTAGAKSVNPAIHVLDGIASMSDSSVSQSAATAQINAGADVIWADMDSAILGVAHAIQGSGKNVVLMGSISPKCSLPTVKDYDVADTTLDQSALIEHVVHDWLNGHSGASFYSLTDPNSVFGFRTCPGKATPEITAAIKKAEQHLRSSPEPQ